MSERQIFIFDHDWQSGNIKKLIIVTATIISFVIHRVIYHTPIYLHLIFDILYFGILSLINWIFAIASYTGSENPAQTRKKNPIHQARNVKNQVQIDRVCVWLARGTINKVVGYKEIALCIR